MAAVSSIVAVGAALAGAALAGAASQVYSGQKQAKAQASAQDQARKNADAQAKTAEEEMNKANQKKPNAAGLLSANEQAAKGGVGGTMLTGPQGVDPGTLQLGKSTLLGQ